MSSSLDPSAPERPWRAARYRKMLAAATDLLRERPLEEIQMEAIARAAGVGKATLYRYFDTKEVLLGACLEQVTSGLCARIEAAEASALAPPDRLRVIVAAMVETFSRHLLPLRLLTRRQGDRRDGWRRSVHRMRQRILGVLRGHFEKGIADGHYRAIDVDLMPALVMGMVRGALMHRPPGSAEPLAEGICEVVLRGCLGPPGRRRRSARR